MQYINLDKEWEYRPGFVDSLGMLSDIEPQIVNLPHDSMISKKTSPDAPAKYDSGYFNFDMCNYTKLIFIPAEWEGEKIGLSFDGVMMHTTIEINGCKVGEHHYGYTPFFIDITDYVSLGQENRITINTNNGVQPSSRWYTGCGIYRSLFLTHSPRVHIKNDGVYVVTKEVVDDVAYLEARIEVCNETLENRLVEVELKMLDSDGCEVSAISRTIQINPVSEETARIAFSVKSPILWDAENPYLYQLKTRSVDRGIFKTHFIKNDTETVDEDSKSFGIRTITVDAVRGLRINGKTVKLKGGCVHHDNGLLGAVSLYESEERKVKKLKEIGFNAIRTAHNPPSAALVEACDRNGMYIFDEAFDAWRMAKRPGDFSTYFEKYWEEELTNFIRRDRIHPSVIMWSTGNEIPERGGLGNGYTLSTRLAETIRKTDQSRPISNGICSFWSGLDDSLSKEQNSAQNAENNEEAICWDSITEPFTNGLDVVGYNYMEDLYENSHKRFPHRVILGSENFPKEIGYRWPLVESLPYVIGDFTWTAWDYIGEAGIGKSLFVDPEDPLAKCKPWEIMPPTTSPYPWRLANDADVDITGLMCPQGAYRSVVWGSPKTFLYSEHPSNMDKVEMMSMWGFIDVLKCWNYSEYLNKPVKLAVFSNADEVALFINGKETDRKEVNKEKPLPNSVFFETVYVPGLVEAVSYKDGVEVSRDKLETSKAPAKIALCPEKNVIDANGHDLAYIAVEILDNENLRVSDAKIKLTVTVEGEGTLAGFGTGRPVTEEIYTDNSTETENGYAMLILRSGYSEGKTLIRVSAEESGLSCECEILCK